uniref:LanC-like protein 3 n=1 Tax=Phallusia mammillata TaxID=59560 RepID=A0A6F9DK67_9ASCI|nr:lanC-like protein 3 [Phallusia mammillata]
MSRYFENMFSDEGVVDISPELFKSRIFTHIKKILKNFKPDEKNCDGGLYVGCAGVAYALYYLVKCGHFPEQSQSFLESAKSYISAALHHCSRKNTRPRNQVSFLLENGGVYAVAALIYKQTGELQKSEEYLQAYRELASQCEVVDFLEHGSDELFVGRAGYLMGVLLLQRDLQTEILPPKQLQHIFEKTLESGVRLRSRLQFDGNIPLMYSYYGTLYLGSGHGIAGILQVLLSFPSLLHRNPSAQDLIKTSVDFLLDLCLQEGNIATDLEEALTSSGRGKYLVHWCHGAAGVIYMFARAYIMFGRNEKYLNVCKLLADTVWRKGLLKKGPGICHGVAGSGYVFILMFRLTGEAKYLYRAERFASFMFTEQFQGGARTPDCPWSLFEGLSGTICFLNDLLNPETGEFPLLDVFVNELSI